MKLFEAQLFKRLQCRPIELPAKEQYIPISPISSLLTWTRRTSYYRVRQSQDNMICDGGSYQASSRWSHLEAKEEHFQRFKDMVTLKN
jgi:hypothetical protein